MYFKIFRSKPLPRFDNATPAEAATTEYRPRICSPEHRARARRAEIAYQLARIDEALAETRHASAPQLEYRTGRIVSIR